MIVQMKKINENDAKKLKLPSGMRSVGIISNIREPSEQRGKNPSEIKFFRSNQLIQMQITILKCLEKEETENTHRSTTKDNLINQPI